MAAHHRSLCMAVGGMFAWATHATAQNAITFLTPTQLGEHGQYIIGFWIVTSGGTTDLERFDFDNNYRLILSGRNVRAPFHTEYAPYQRLDRSQEDGGLGQYGGNRNEYRGLRSTVERTGKRCPQYYWWMPTVIDFNDAHTYANENTFDPAPDNQCVARRPSDGTTIRASYRRFTGVTFVPLANGRYMATTFVPGVGNQRAQYRGAAQLRWDYSALPAANVQLKLTRPEGGDSPLTYPLRGTYPLSAMQPGRYEFEFRVFGPRGDVIHTDVASVDLPGPR